MPRDREQVYAELVHPRADLADGLRGIRVDERTMIVRQAMENFSCNSKAADEMLGYARFLLADNRDPNNCFLKLKSLILSKCGPKERADLIAMVRAVAGADGEPGAVELKAIDVLAHELLV